MSSSKEARAARGKVEQEARRTAERRLREAHPEEYAVFMTEEHEARGLVWNRRATPEERARREQEEREAKARERIEREARKAGIEVLFLNENGVVVTPEEAAEHIKERADRFGLPLNEPEEERRTEKVAAERAAADEADQGAYAMDGVR